MTDKAKAVNYTDELTKAILEKFAAGVSVADLATFAGKSTRSIVAKLSREGVYKAKGKEKAEARVTKDELVSKIAEHLGVPEDSVDSLEKATLGTLKIVLAGLEAHDEVAE